MKRIFNAFIKPLIRKCGIDVTSYHEEPPAGENSNYPSDFSELNIQICDSVRKFTMTTAERINSVIEAVRYISTNKIPGSMVECGVWRGGSTMAMALTLRDCGDETRDIYLYDTFSGMSTPTDADISCLGTMAQKVYSKTIKSQGVSNWCLSTKEEVGNNVFSTEYPKEKFYFIKGKVEETIPKTMPKKIALLRLDTDWYESTKHELLHLFPLLSTNGVLIIDDYGYWEGARKAVDEYVSENKLCMLLNRIDDTGRIAIKISK
jgi:O-methyltransferase